MSLLSRVSNALRTERLDRELSAEVQFHLDSLADDLTLKRGLTREAAVREAHRIFGSELRTRETSREAKLMPWLESVAADIRSAWRTLLRERRVAAISVLALGLATGGSMAALAMLDALALRGLSVPDAAGVVHLKPSGGRDGFSFSFAQLSQLRESARDHAMLFGVAFGGPLQRAAFEPEREEPIRPQWISANALGMLGIEAAIGHTRLANEDAVLSYDYWQRRFGARTDVLGRSFSFSIRGFPIARYRVAGVAARGFTGLETGQPADVWLPIETRNTGRGDFPSFQIFARLLAGITAEDLQRAVSPVGVEATAEGPTFIREKYSGTVWILTVLTGLAALCACAGVANLLAARQAARQAEMTLRSAMGAGRWRLIQQRLAESTLLAAGSAIVGLALAVPGAPFLVRMMGPADFPAYLDVAPNMRWAALLMVPVPFLALSTGLAPDSRRVLRCLQVSLSVAVLLAAGLLVRSFVQLQHVDPGFTPDNVHLFTLGPPVTGDVTPAEVVERVKRIEGVEAAGLSSCGLLSEVRIPQLPPGVLQIVGQESQPLTPYFLSVTPEFLSTMKIPLEAGTAGGPGVLINRAFARAYLGTSDPLTRMLSFRGRRGMPRISRITGVVRDSKYFSLREAGMPAIFVPLEGTPGATLAVRLREGSKAGEVLRAIRQAVPVTSESLQAQRLGESLLRERLLAVPGAFLLALIFLITLAGLYGEVGYFLTRRRREMSIRMVLGATPWRAVSDSTGDDMQGIVLGVVAGLALGVWLSGRAAGYLFGARPTEAVSLLLPLLMVLVALAPALLAARRRLTRMDPHVALRLE